MTDQNIRCACALTLAISSWTVRAAGLDMHEKLFRYACLGYTWSWVQVHASSPD